MKHLLSTLVIVVAASATRAQLQVPSALSEEHEEIHAALAKATRVGGQTGKAAQALEAVLGPHFVREQQIALPPLGVLRNLSVGKNDPNLPKAVRLSRQLAKELPGMLAEHKKIGAALDRLEAAARRERRFDQARLAETIRLHARTEEQITYPAAILVAKVAGS